MSAVKTSFQDNNEALVELIFGLIKKLKIIIISVFLDVFQLQYKNLWFLTVNIKVILSTFWGDKQ